MSYEESGNQTPVKIDKDLKKRLQEFVNSEEAQNMGFKHMSTFVNQAVRELLEKYDVNRFEHLNFEDNCIRLIDNEKPKGSPFIELRLNGNTLYCDTCNQENCEHVDAAWSDSNIKDKLKDKGFNHT